MERNSATTSSPTPPESSATPKSSTSLIGAFSSSVRTNSPNSNAPKAILSCDFCRQRKTKCDKVEGGCSNCKRAGIKCNMPTRQRLPRGRNGGRTKVDAELKARVGRLESLVRSLGGSGRLDDADALEKVAFGLFLFGQNVLTLLRSWPKPLSRRSLQGARNLPQRHRAEKSAREDQSLGGI